VSSASAVGEPLDPLIHETARLTIIAVLAECDRASFNFLLSTTSLTRGNLSTHLRRLTEAGYVEESKEIVDRKPLSEYWLTRTGRDAYTRYRKAWGSLTGGRKKTLRK
jgi:DNA-binding transcriptional ArsR family regulator